ncbi:MAG: hypothetical protein IPH11_10450 [Ignavibacteriales bacterium]|nr:hypothetical protein [Ignavibacteriales bacterium]
MDKLIRELELEPELLLFSGKAKFRLMAEPFIGRSNDGYYQSLAEFVKRRLGQEFLDYAINPFVAGVYARSPKN